MFTRGLGCVRWRSKVSEAWVSTMPRRCGLVGFADQRITLTIASFIGDGKCFRLTSTCKALRLVQPPLRMLSIGRDVFPLSDIADQLRANPGLVVQIDASLWVGPMDIEFNKEDGRFPPGADLRGIEIERCLGGYPGEKLAFDHLTPVSARHAAELRRCWLEDNQKFKMDRTEPLEWAAAGACSAFDVVARMSARHGSELRRLWLDVEPDDDWWGERFAFHERPNIACMRLGEQLTALEELIFECRDRSLLGPAYDANPKNAPFQRDCIRWLCWHTSRTLRNLCIYEPNTTFSDVRHILALCGPGLAGVGLDVDGHYPLLFKGGYNRIDEAAALRAIVESACPALVEPPSIARCGYEDWRDADRDWRHGARGRLEPDVPADYAELAARVAAVADLPPGVDADIMVVASCKPGRVAGRTRAARKRGAARGWPADPTPRRRRRRGPEPAPADHDALDY